MIYLYIEADNQDRTHLSLDRPEFVALCRKRVFPSKWYRPAKQSKPLCPACFKKSGV